MNGHTIGAMMENYDVAMLAEHNVMHTATRSKIFNKRINILFRVLTFAKPECVNVLQPDPRSGEGCNTLIHEGFANVNTRKRLLYRHCYIPSFLVHVFTIQSKNNLSKFHAEGFNVH